MRYDTPERLYLCALTKPPEQARVFLRQAVLHDEKIREFPTPKYLHALAEREESDKVLKAFTQAYQRDPGNASLAIRFGCRLFDAGAAEEAPARFREAGQNAPHNALPGYLEAAVLPWASKDLEDLRPSLALIAANNNSGKRVEFPRPLWSSELPRFGAWHATLCRNSIQRCTAPFYRFIELVANRSKEQTALHRRQQWDSWLGHVETMGDRIASGAVHKDEDGAVQPTGAGAALQAELGLRIQLAALRERERFQKSAGGTGIEALIQHRLALEKALAALEAFEETRADRIALDERAYAMPLRLTSASLGVLFLLYSVCYGISRVLGSRGPGMAIPLGTTGRAAPLGASVAFFLLLAGGSAVHRLAGEEQRWMVAFPTAWWVLLGCLAVFGLVYPVLILPSASTVCQRENGETRGPECLRAARKRCGAAWVVLTRRYYGMALGLLLCACCGWIVAHRVSVSLYPWQTGLLATSLVEEETVLVSDVLNQVATEAGDPPRTPAAPPPSQGALEE